MLATTAAPTLTVLRSASARFTELGNVDRSWNRYAEATAPAIDLSLAEHREATLTWLNSWACRIPRGPGFGDGVAAWWSTLDLPAAAGLLSLSDSEADAIGVAFDGLAEIRVGRRRVGPTAAAKLLYALRPHGIMPWDAAIAGWLHGARDGRAFAAHQKLGRDWARTLVEATGTAEEQLPQLIGRPSVSLAKLLDEYTYLIANNRMAPAG
ncbi:hypothetical protein [Hamadaea tsunoensis]|uniref:hypothetical protein n=1 Tax=Hamadaea tsunoensis TaxID=53368 RepID=UPI00040435E4|nr:hypothetical protein [Hamadaea tsunoensis]